MFTAKYILTKRFQRMQHTPNETISCNYLAWRLEPAASACSRSNTIHILFWMRFLAPLPETKLDLLGLHDLVLYQYVLSLWKQDPELQFKREKANKYSLSFQEYKKSFVAIIYFIFGLVRGSCCIVQPVLEFTMQWSLLRWASCFSLFNSGFAGTCYHTWFSRNLDKQEPWQDDRCSGWGTPESMLHQSLYFCVDIFYNKPCF